MISNESTLSSSTPDSCGLRVLHVTSACDPEHTIAASAFWWADALAQRCARVDVVALDTGGCARSNMKLHSLFRRRTRSRWRVATRLLTLLARLVPTVDVVFCQYSTKFVFACWPFAFVFRKPVVLWWSHGHVDWKLRLATRLVSAVVTSSPDSFRSASAKKRVIGHGIDVETFSPLRQEAVGTSEMSARIRILSLGRITPVKDVRTIVAAAGILRARGRGSFTLDLVGDTGRSGDAEYLGELKALSRKLHLDDIVHFIGPVPHSNAVALLRDADIFINAQAAGGVGRAWLEAMAVGVPSVLCTSALDQVLNEDDRQLLRFRDHDPEDLADRLGTLITLPVAERRDLGLRMRKIVVRDHSLDHLAGALVGVFLNVTGRGDLTQMANE